MIRGLLALALLALPAFAQLPKSASGGGGGGGATIASTSNVLKGDGAGNGSAATPGTDYYVPLAGLALGDLPASAKVRTCEIIIGDPGSASAALANDNDAPVVCGNDSGASMTITAVKCYADAGSPTVQPQITGGANNSILSSALTCGTGSFASGTLNGTPTESNGGTIDGNIITAGGTAKYIVIRITRTL